MLSFLDPVMNFSRLHLNPIRELQELCQSHNWDLDFVSSKKDKTVEVKVNGKDISGCATNLSRKAAERMAAKQVISTLKVNFACFPYILHSLAITIIYFAVLFLSLPGDSCCWDKQGVSPLAKM